MVRWHGVRKEGIPREPPYPHLKKYIGYMKQTLKLNGGKKNEMSLEITCLQKKSCEFFTSKVVTNVQSQPRGVSHPVLC